MKTLFTLSFFLSLFFIAPAQAVTPLRVMLIGWPLYDTENPVTQRPVKSVYSLFKKFEAENPDIKLELIAAQWGSGGTGYLPKTRALLLSRAIDVFEAPLVSDFANQRTIENLEPWIARDLDTTDYLPGALDRFAAFTWSDGAYHRYALPIYYGVRMNAYDRQIFRDFGVDTLSPAPSPQEVLDKAARMTGTNPKTGKTTYGLYFEGRHKLFLVTNLLDAFGGAWGGINRDGTLRCTWTLPQNEEAVLWLLRAVQYCPPSLMGSGEGVESLWGTQDNFIGIRIHADANNIFRQNYTPGIRLPDHTQRFRYVQIFRNPNGGGGFAFGSPLAMVSASPHKPEAWRFIKWMSQGSAAQGYLVDIMNTYPVTRSAYQNPVFRENENFRYAMDEMNVPVKGFPYASTPIRYALENELDKAFLAARECKWDTLRLRAIAREYLRSVQKASDAWTASLLRCPPSQMRPFNLRAFAAPFFAVLALGIVCLLFWGRKTLRRYAGWYLFLLPSLCAMVLFLAYPIAESFRLSLYHSNGFLEGFAGFGNYSSVLRDPGFLNSLYNTGYIALFTLTLGIPLGFVLASLINSQKRGRAAFKVLYFMPMVTSVIASAVLFKYLFSPDMGLVNYLLQKFGLPGQNLLWLSSPATSKFVVVLFALWHGTGYTVLICLSGLQSVPDQLYEAAGIDGCSGLQKWWYITLPNMRPTLVFLVMTGCIGALKRFEDVFTFGGMLGQPARSLQTVVAYIFEQAFGAFNFGAASAAAYLLFAIILVITLVNYRVTLNKEI